MQTSYPQTIRDLQGPGNARLTIPTPRELKDVTFPQGRMNDPPGGFGQRTVKKEMPGWYGMVWWWTGGRTGGRACC